MFFDVTGRDLYIVKVDETEVKATDDFINKELTGLRSVSSVKKAHEGKLVQAKKSSGCSFWPSPSPAQRKCGSHGCGG